MKTSISISAFFKSIGRLLKRFNMTIFILGILVALIYAVVSINNMLNQAATDTTYVPNNVASSFDTTVMDQINQLHTSDTPLNLTLPSGRINPFSE